MTSIPSLLLSLPLVLALAASLAPAQTTHPGAPPVPAAPLPFTIPGTAPSTPLARLGPVFDVAPGFDDDGTSMVYDLTRVAANGVSLRQCTSGAINLVGVPPGSRIVRAFLYWQWISVPAPLPGLQDTLYFGALPRVVPNPAGGLALPVRCRARRVRGTLVGAGADPCWLGGGNFTYRANVTNLVKRGGTFTVWLPPGAAPGADWNDPFSQFAFPPGPYCEGASLVVVYQGALEPPGTTLIYDSGLAGTMFQANPGLSYNLTGFVAPGSESRWIHIGGDGQSGSGYGDTPGLGYELTAFQGLSLAGGGAGFAPPSLYTDSDWNGSGNKPVGQLWDTSGHEVSAYLQAGATSANVFFFDPALSPQTDCLVPVADVLWIR